MSNIQLHPKEEPDEIKCASNDCDMGVDNISGLPCITCDGWGFIAVSKREIDHRAKMETHMKHCKRCEALRTKPHINLYGTNHNYLIDGNEDDFEPFC